MEEQPIVQTPTQPSSASPAPQKKSMPNIWKFLTLLLLAVIVLGGAYFLGTQKSPTALAPTTTPAAQISSSPTGANQSPTVTQSVIPTQSQPAGKKVSAGVKTDAFIPYTIVIPTGWTNAHTYESTVDKLVITKGAYSLTIVEGGGGGGICTYPGEAPQQMSQAFTSFVGITGTQSQLRRGTSDGINHTVCEQKTSGFGFPTQFGYITYVTPSSADASVLAEMDGMVASITK